jgi:hypothetical protein
MVYEGEKRREEEEALEDGNQALYLVVRRGQEGYRPS